MTAGGRAGGVRTLLQPARAQCLRLSERFFHYSCYTRKKRDRAHNVVGGGARNISDLVNILDAVGQLAEVTVL